MGKKRPITKESIQEFDKLAKQLEHTADSIYSEIRHYLKQGHILYNKSWIMTQLIEEFREQLERELKIEQKWLEN